MKNNAVKIFLYFVFICLIAGSGVLLFYEMYKGNEDPGGEEPITIISPEELIVDDNDKTKLTIDADVVKMSPDVDLAQERKKHKNNDIIARLEVPDVFNVLVVKGKDNKYYLDYSVDKKKDIKGATFMDFRNNVNNNQINIYGHNSRDSKLAVPFRRLEKFLDKSFFDSHPYIIFQFDTGKRVYKITSIKEVTESQNEHMRVTFTGQKFVDHVEKLRTGAIFKRDIKIDESSKIIVLQTCSHHLKNAFYIITGVSINYVESN
jgi:SrtB family sortase